MDIKGSLPAMVKVLFVHHKDTKEESNLDLSLLLEYGWVLIVLVVLEGLLAADNALVLAIMVKHLPDEKRKRRYSTVCSEPLSSG